jgi:hypothetical protein
MDIVYQNGVAGKICVNPECGGKPLNEFPKRQVHGKPVGDGFKARCRDCWNAQSRTERAAKPEECRVQNLEHYREIGRKSYERHADQRRKHSLEYYKLHPEKSVAATNRRRALRYNSATSHTEEEWQTLKAFCEYKCLCCSRREPEIKLTRDDAIPLTKGGSDSIHNINHCVLGVTAERIKNISILGDVMLERLEDPKLHH